MKKPVDHTPGKEYFIAGRAWRYPAALGRVPEEHWMNWILYMRRYG